MALRLELSQEVEPALLGHQTPKQPMSIDDEQLPRPELDEQLLYEFERGVGLDRDGCLMISLSPCMTS